MAKTNWREFKEKRKQAEIEADENKIETTLALNKAKQAKQAKIKQAEADFRTGKTKIAPKQVRKPAQPEILTSGNRASGIVLPGGERFLGLRPSEVEAMAKTDVGLPNAKGGAEAAAGLEKQQELAAQQKAAQGIKVGQVNIPENIKAPAVSYKEAITQGITNAGIGAAGGAATGAVIGAAAGAGVGAIPGAIGGTAAGLIGGFLQGFRSSLKEQRGEAATARGADVKTITTNLKGLITDSNKNPEHLIENLEMFQTQLTLMSIKYSELKRLSTSGIIAKEHAIPELERYEMFFSEGGARDLLVSKMNNAIIMPDPNVNLLSVEDLMPEAVIE